LIIFEHPGRGYLTFRNIILSELCVLRASAVNFPQGRAVVNLAFPIARGWTKED